MRLLFVSPHCLLDRTSGAALSVTTQLEELARLGWSCRALKGSVLDHRKRVDAKVQLQPWGVGNAGTAAGKPLWGSRRNGVEHIIVPFSDSRRGAATAREEQFFFALFRQQIASWKPDLIYSYGGMLLERALLREARRQNIATAFYLANAEYHDAATFDDADAIFTPSAALAIHYRDRLGITAEPIGSFTRIAIPSASSEERGNADRVVFINPASEKGLSCFLAIARACLHRLPRATFLVVESRATRQSVDPRYTVDWGELPNVEFLVHQQDMTYVYSRAQVLLFPALWFEAAGRTLLEAQAHGIPVLASSHGGIGEQLNGGGFLFDIPARCRSDYFAIPTIAEIAPWLDCLETMLGDPAAYAAASARARGAVARHDISDLASNFDKLLRRLQDTDTQGNLS